MQNNYDNTNDFNEIIINSLLNIEKVCIVTDNCAECPLKIYCGKLPSEWGE